LWSRSVRVTLVGVATCAAGVAAAGAAEAVPLEPSMRAPDKTADTPSAANLLLGLVDIRTFLIC
jgi:hypothetical protein